MTLLALKDKALYLVVVVLLTLLGAMYYDRSSIQEDLASTKANLVSEIAANDRLLKQNEQLAEDLSKKPKEVVRIVKESTAEICKAQVAQEAIKNLPTTKREVTDEKATAGIDDSLPDDLKRLLK